MPRARSSGARVCRLWLDIHDAEGQLFCYTVAPVVALDLKPWEMKAYRVRKLVNGEPDQLYLCVRTRKDLRCTCQAGFYRVRCKHLDALVALHLLEEPT